MIVSMTGIGKGEIENDSLKISIEIKSYNSRFFEFTPKTPVALSIYDDILVNLLKKKLIRGKIAINSIIQYHDIDSELEIDKNKLNFYIDKGNEIKNLINAKEGLNVNQLMQYPNIFIR